MFLGASLFQERKREQASVNKRKKGWPEPLLDLRGGKWECGNRDG
jgi:hypothetical protein